MLKEPRFNLITSIFPSHIITTINTALHTHTRANRRRPRQSIAHTRFLARLVHSWIRRARYIPRSLGCITRRRAAKAMMCQG